MKWCKSNNLRPALAKKSQCRSVHTSTQYIVFTWRFWRFKPCYFFWSILITLKVSNIFWGSWGSSKNCLVPKMNNDVDHNPWHTLYSLQFYMKFPDLLSKDSFYFYSISKLNCLFQSSEKKPCFDTNKKCWVFWLSYFLTSLLGVVVFKLKYSLTR